MDIQKLRNQEFKDMGFEPGGRADKLGNRYERRWTAKQFLRLVNEEIQSVTIEAIGDDEKGVDLWIEDNFEKREAHQCKSRNKSKKSWSIADLNNRGGLQHICRQLDRSPSYEFWFVSSIPVELLNDICDSARNSNSEPEDFYKDQEKISKYRKKTLDQFYSYIKVDTNSKKDLEKAFKYLQRLRIELYPDTPTSYNELLTQAGFLFTGDPETTIQTIIGFAENHDGFGKPICANHLREFLVSKGIHPKNLAHDKRILPAVEKLNKNFDESIALDLIKDKLIHREETDRCLKAIQNDGMVLLHGASDSGKSVVLYEVVQKLRAEDTVCLPVRLDRKCPQKTAAIFGDAIGLVDSPANCLAAIAGDRKSVLILDQLDAIRWTAQHSSSALDVCKELVEQVKAFQKNGKKITVLLACRTFDLENDLEIKNWLKPSNENKVNKIEVGPLSEKNLREYAGEKLDSMSSSQKTILSNPQNLNMWCKLLSSEKTPRFDSAAGLMREFWNFKTTQIEKNKVNIDEVNNVLETLVNWLDKKRKISAPVRILTRYPSAINALKSHGVIQEQNSQISFCHQIYLDFLIAERLLKEIDEGSGIIDWLGSLEKQTLFRRDQLRLALTLLGDESPPNFLKTVMEMLPYQTVRFHLKHLVLELIGQFENIPEKLANYCIELLEDEKWKPHIIEAVFWGNAHFIKILIKRDIIGKWLNAKDETLVNQALQLLQSVMEKIPDMAVSQLTPFLKKGAEWEKRIFDTLCVFPVDYSESMMDIRIQLVKKRLENERIRWEDMSSQYPVQTLQYIEAMISTWDISDENDKTYNHFSTAKKWYQSDLDKLSKAAEDYSKETWELFLPHIVRLTSFEASVYDDRITKWQKGNLCPHNPEHTGMPRGVVDLTIIAGRKLAKENPEFLITSAKPLENSISLVIKAMLIEIYAHLPAEYADIGVRWLLSDPKNLNIGRGSQEIEWTPAVKLVEALSPHCSKDVFLQLERSLVNYHSPDEKESIKLRFELKKQGSKRRVNHLPYWGAAQFFLLPALAVNRVYQQTNELISVLKRQFDGVPEDDFKYVSCWFVLIDSKIKTNADKLNDSAWLKIIKNKKIPVDHTAGKFVPMSEKKTAESSVWLFSGTLRETAKKSPERFGKLALKFPQDTHHMYISAIIDAMSVQAPEQTPIDIVVKFLEKFLNSNTNHLAIDFCGMVQKRADEKWPDFVIEKIIHIAMNHHNPDPLDSERGTAAYAIADLLLKHPDWMEKLKPGIESLLSDRHPSIRIASIKILQAIYNFDEAQAVNWFCMLSEKDLRVPSSFHAYNFFNRAISKFYGQLKPLVVNMINSSLNEASTCGAELAADYFLIYDLFEEELELCRTGTVAQRKGVVKSISSLINDADYAEKCYQLMSPFLNDPEDEVRNSIKFRLGKDLISTQTGVAFIEEVIQSKTFTSKASQIFRDLNEFSGDLIPCHSIILNACNEIKSSHIDKTRNFRSLIHNELSLISTLLLRLYEQSIEEHSDIANQCLDAWDTFYEHRVGFVRKLTKDIEDKQ